MAEKNIKNTETGAEEIVSKSEQFVEKNINKIIIAVLVVIAVVAGFFAYNHFVKKPNLEKAQEKLFPMEEQFIANRDSVALNGMGVGNPGLLEIIQKYKGSAAANLAEAYAGICYYDMGDYQKALDHLAKFKTDETVVAPSIVRLMGDCYVQLGKYNEAVDCFMKAASQASNPAVSPSCLLKAGHVYEKMGDNAKAVEVYNEIKTKYYMAPEFAQAEADLVRAEAALKGAK